MADAQKYQREHTGYPWTNSHNENHFLLQLPVVIVLWTDFPVEMQQLLQVFAARRHAILDYRHEQLGLMGRRVATSVYYDSQRTSSLTYLGVTIDSEDYDFPQCVDFDLV